MTQDQSKKIQRIVEAIVERKLSAKPKLNEHKYSDRNNTFYIAYDSSGSNKLKYQVPYILPGETELINFDIDDLDREKRLSIQKITKLANDQMNDIVADAEFSIKQLGLKAVAQIRKLVK